MELFIKKKKKISLGATWTEDNRASEYYLSRLPKQLTIPQNRGP